MTQTNKYNLEVGTRIHSYYGNTGVFNMTKTITRLTNSSVFFDAYDGQRESYNTVNSKLDSGTYKLTK